MLHQRRAHETWWIIAYEEYICTALWKLAAAMQRGDLHRHSFREGGF
jgi:hypothetical protein